MEKYEELYEERRHLENLLNTRFNFFLVVFAAILAALFTIKNGVQFRLILLLGAIIESVLAIVIARAQLKLGFYLYQIRKTRNHAERAASFFANNRRTCFLINGSRNWIIGYFLPILVSLLLIASSICSNRIYDLLKSGNNSENVLKIEVLIDNKSIGYHTVNLDSSNTITMSICNEHLERNILNLKNDTLKNQHLK